MTSDLSLLLARSTGQTSATPSILLLQPRGSLQLRLNGKRLITSAALLSGPDGEVGMSLPQTSDAIMAGQAAAAREGYSPGFSWSQPGAPSHTYEVQLLAPLFQGLPSDTGVTIDAQSDTGGQ